MSQTDVSEIDFNRNRVVQSIVHAIRDRMDAGQQGDRNNKVSMFTRLIEHELTTSGCRLNMSTIGITRIIYPANCQPSVIFLPR
jgi:hypothetical protein